MEIFKLFILGSVGYFLSYLLDLAILRGKELLKRFLLVGMFLTAAPYAFLFLMFDSPFGGTARTVMFIVFCVLGSLLLFSVFLEVELFSNGEKGKLYKGGTYRISRHPGFLWYTGINCVIALYFLRLDVLTLVIGLTLDNFLLILVEDRVLFPRMFDGYDDYKKEVPFLYSFRRLGGMR